ncbi:MAG TPA: ABC transporter permease [Verrucomicrobiota bacterium]|nr:ABC transporter permease [Verrucomicrobiota bacterium]HNU52092.1 ABC transporter permease [Verrucomicrobiota bacterium]
MGHDLRFAIRMLLKHPAFTAVAVLSLALGIGANTTVFCWIQTVLLRPLPGVSDPARLAVLCTRHANVNWETMCLPDVQDCRGQTNAFEGIVASQITPACLTIDGRPEWVYGQIASANFFTVLGVQPVIGRFFVADEDLRPGGAPVLVLAEGYWRRRFAGDTNILGQTLDLNRHQFTVIGVAPASFRGTMSGLRFDFWAPITMHQQVAHFGSLTSRGDHWVHVLARLQRGVSMAQAQGALDVLARRLQTAYPDTNHEVDFLLLPLWRSPYGGQMLLLPVLRLLLAVTLGVLLIVSANVANLLLARATLRLKEVAIRQALGAGRWRLVRQLLTESLLLAVLGGLLGVLFTHWAVGLIAHLLPNTYLPIGYTFVVDTRTLAFTLGLTLLTCLLFGTVPALQTARLDLNAHLKEGGRSSTAASAHHRLRNALVVAEIALALVLLVGAVLCLRGFQRARQIDLGFDPRQVLCAGLRIGMHGYTETTSRVFYRQLRERLASLNGVESVGLTSWLPLGFEGGSSTSIDVPGYDRKPNEDLGVAYCIVSPGYFETLRIPLIEGRDFQEHDDLRAPRRVIINEAVAKRFFANQNPVGRTLKCFDGRECTVIGIVKTGKYRSLSEPPKGGIYLSYQQCTWDLNLSIALRTRGPVTAFVPTLRRTLHEIDPGVELWGSLAMTDYIQAAFLPQRITATFLMILGGVALFLAAIGIYAVMAYVVSQRTQEIGVRRALGAREHDILRLVFAQGLRLSGLGVVAGWIGALLATRALSSFLYGVSPFDPFTFAAVAAGLVVVSLIACAMPAHRALRVDPIVALRQE